MILEKTFRLIKRIYKYTVGTIFNKLIFEDVSYIGHGSSNKRYELKKHRTHIPLNKIRIMNKIIAILTKKGLLSNGIQEDADLNIFKLEENKVVGYEKIKINDNESSDFFTLLRSKKINLLYLDTLANDIRNLIEKFGITIRFKEECDDDKFLNAFIFS